MSEKNKESKKRRDRKYLFAILDNDTHDFRFIIRGTKHSAIFAVAGTAALLCIITFCLTAFSPIKRIIPGYPSYTMQREAVENAAKVDSLETRMRIMTLQLTNIRMILSGEAPIPLDSLLSRSGLEEAERTAESLNQSADSILREKIDSIEKYNLKIAIENHCDLFADEVIWMVEQLNHPLIGACCDTINSLMLAEGIKDCIDKMAPYCYCVHFCDNRVFADPDGTHSLGCAIGDGDVDVIEVMKILREKAPEELDTIDLEIELPLSGYTIEDGRKEEIDAMRKSIKYMHEVLDIGIKGR